MLTLTWVTDILFYELRPKTGRGVNLKSTLCTMFPSLGEDFMQNLFSFLKFNGDPHSDALIIGSNRLIICLIIG